MKRKINELSVEDLEKYKKEEQEKIDQTRREYKTIGNRIIQLLSTMRKIEEALDEKTLNLNNIEKLLQKFPETNTRRKLLREYLETICGENYHLVIDSSGYWPDTNQSAIRISLYQNNYEITKRVFVGILKLLPYIKPIRTGAKMFDIFEHTLSYNHSFYLAYYENENIFAIIDEKEKRRFHSDDLMEVLKHIQEHYYYEINYPL